MCKRPFCETCNRTDGLRWDAWASWHEGRKELHSDFDNVWCENCESMVDVRWEEPVLVSVTIHESVMYQMTMNHYPSDPLTPERAEEIWTDVDGSYDQYVQSVGERELDFELPEEPDTDEDPQPDFVNDGFNV